MKFHTLIALSEFEARFDDATLRRPLVARRNPEAAGGGPASEPSRNPEAPTIIPDGDAPQPGMLLPGILDDAPRPVGDTPQPDLVAPRNLMVLPPKLDDAPQPVDDAPQPDTAAPPNPMVLPPKLDDAPQPVGDAPRPVGDAPQPVGDTPRPDGDAPRPVGDAPQPVGVASNRTDRSSSKKASTPGGDDGLELVDMSGSSIEVQVKHHKDTSAEVQVMLQAYHKEVDAFQRRRERYEREIKALDRSIGPRYTKELQYRRLAAEEAALQRRGGEINAQGEAIRLAEEWLRANAGRINDRIKAVRANERRIQRRINERRLAEFLRQETSEGVITREDTDGDGKIDQKTLTDPDGNVVSKTEYHYADDGTVDRVVVTTAEGVETHLDADGDGKIDQRTLTDLEGNQTTDTQYHFADDGTVDRITVTTAEGVETHLDTDGDGKIDQKTLIDAEGNQTTDTQYHFADDGKVDRITVTTAEGVETRRDTDGDGKIDQRTLTDLEGNQTTDTQYHFADDGTIDRITVTNAEGVETHLDTDGDGKIDQKTLTDLEGNQTTDTVYHYTDDGKIDRMVVTTAEGVETHLDTDGDGKIDQKTLTDLEGNQTTDTQYHFADDGKVDRITVTTAEGVETHLDTDGDGKIDQKTLTDLEGNQTTDTVYHYTDDGKIDRMVVTTAEGVETHLDTDGDGKIDQKTLTDLEGNQTTDTQYHFADDGKVDRITVTTAEGVETHLDTDGDGKIDQKTLTDLEGNQTSDTQYHYTDDGKIDRMVVTTAEGVETHLDTDGDGKIDQKTLTDLEGNQTSDTQYHFADDGKVDRITVTTAEGVETHLDTDGDGKIDQRTLIDAEGNQTTDTQYHFADDGTVDRITVTTAEGVETHLDTDGDGKIDQRTLTDLEGNQTTDTQYHFADDGKVDRITVTTAEGVETRLDTDGDGKIDQITLIDAEGNQTSDTQYHFADDGKVDRITVTTPEGVTVHTDSNGDGKIDYMSDAGSAGDAVDFLDSLTNGGSASPSGQWSREQGTGTWYNIWELEDDSGIKLVGAAYNVLDENTVVADGTVSINGREARVRTTYTRNPDGTITRQSRLVNYYENDAPGSGGGGGGGGEATYTVAADGTVTMEQDGHTYTIRDEDRAEAIRNAPTIDVTEIDQNTPDGEYLTADGQMVQVSDQDNGRQTTRMQGSGEVTVMDDARYFQRDVAELQAAGQVAVSPEEISQLSDLGRDLTLEWGDTPFAEKASAAVSAYAGITDVPPTGVEVGGRQGFDQGLALAELQTDLQRVSEGKTNLTAVLAKWEADPRSATLMLEGPRERLYGEEVGEYEGPPTSISATEWLSQAVAAETQQFEDIFRQVTSREPSGNRARDAAVLSQYGENPLTDMGYAAEVQAFENIFRQVTGREPSGDLAKDADILSRYGENAVTDMGYAGEVQAFEKEERERQEMILPGETGQIGTQVNIDPVTGTLQVSQGVAPIVQAQKEERERQEMILPGETGVIGDQVNIDPVTGALQVSPGVMPAVAASQAEERERQERERRVAQLESKFRDEVLQTGDAPGGFVESVLDSQIEGGGLPTNHPDFPEYDQLRTEMDGPHWRREQISSATQQLLDDSTIWTIDIGPAKDAISALVTGRHVSNYDSSIPVPVNAGVLPVIGTLADANIRGADGYSRGDVAWLAGMGALDVLPIPGVGTLARTSKGAMVVIRNLPAAGGIATGGRRTLASVTQGTLKAPYQVTGTHPKPQGVSNIPVHMGGEVVVDGQLVPAWEGLLRQRDEALQQYRQTGMSQSIDLSTADGGIQTVWVGGSRAATSYGTGGMVHTSPMAGLLTELSQTPEGFVGKVKVGKSGQLLPDVEQRHFMTTQGVPAFREGSAFNKTLYEDPSFSPGYQTFVDPRNLADVEHVRKVFGGDVDTGVMRPSAVVELEGGVPQYKVIAGGPDKPQLYQEYPVSLQKTRGITEHMYVDVPPDLQVGRLEVFRDNVLAEVDRLRGRTETFYVAHQKADGTIEVLRKADMDALAAAGVSLDDALRVRTRAGETRFIAPIQWDSAVRRFSTAVARGNDERHDFENAQDRGLDNRDTFGAGVRTPNGNPPLGSVDVVGRPDGRYALGGDGPLRISAPALTARLSGPGPGIARPTPSPIPMVEPQPDARVPDLRIPDAHGPDARVADPRIPHPPIPDAHGPDARVADPRIPHPPIPDARVPDARIADPRIPYPPIPDAHVPDARVADPRIPYPPIPDAHVPDARVADPRVTYARIPGIGTPDLTRQRRVRLPEVDEAPMTVVKAEEGLYPRVVAHDELIRVYHDLDTGEVRTEPLVLPTEPIIVKHDDTPPPIESRFAGHRRITPRGGYVFTKPVGERRRKASSKRHPYLRKGELRRR